MLFYDDENGHIEPAAEPFTMWRLSDLALPSDDLHKMAAAFGPLAFATYLKPLLFRALFAAGADSLVYFDPNICVFSDIGPLTELVRKKRIVLAPYATAPTARNPQLPDEGPDSHPGSYDLGFVGLRQDQDAFLTLWAERMQSEWTSDGEDNRFIGQQWIDAVPGMFDCHILLDPGCDVAYWNLNYRHLMSDGDTYIVNGSPLTFFHFSGFNPLRPYLLVDYRERHPQTLLSDVLLSEHPPLRRLCREYGERLIAEGFAEASCFPLPYEVLPNGVELTPKLRRLYRNWVAEEEALSRQTLDPFIRPGADEFTAYVSTPPAANALSPYLDDEYSRRLDLQIAFPDPAGKHWWSMLTWAAGEVEAGRLDSRLAPDLKMAAMLSGTGPTDQWASPEDTRSGICVSGYLRAELGLGQEARLLMETIRRGGIPLGTYVYRNTSNRQMHPITEAPRFDLNTNLIVVNFDQIDYFAREVGPEFFEGRYNIGSWAWELENFPECYHESLNYLDEVWAISEFTRDAVASATEKPVFTFPLPIVEPPLPNPLPEREYFSLPSGYMFLFCFDLLSEIERKNPVGLIKAFTTAFEPGEGPILAIKAVNASVRAGDMERLRYAIGDRQDVVLLERFLNHDENAALIAIADCYVSLHRAEGFGLTMAEAMALGTPVIGTGYSGNMDFMNEDNSFLVPWVSSSVPHDCGPYPAGGRWAEPDLKVAAQLMRHVVKNPKDAERRAAQGKANILVAHSVEARVDFVLRRFEHAQQVLSQKRANMVGPQANCSPASKIVTHFDGHERPRSILRETRMKLGRSERELASIGREMSAEQLSDDLS